MIPPPPTQPDGLAVPRSETFDKGADRPGDEGYASGHHDRRRLPGEHVMLGAGSEAGAQLEAPLERLATEDLGVDGALEFRETVEVPRRRPGGQPVEVAIRARHEAVGARRDVHDDLAPRHSGNFSAARITPRGRSARDRCGSRRGPGPHRRQGHGQHQPGHDAKVSGSAGLTPTSRPRRSPPAPYAAARPMPARRRPAAGRRARPAGPPRPAVAPRARRMPNSRRRCATPNARMPCRPAAAIASAATENRPTTTAASRCVETLLTTASRIRAGGVSASCGSMPAIVWRSSPPTAPRVPWWRPPRGDGGTARRRSRPGLSGGTPASGA